ncbi:MAG TPA: sigma-70 family RNA polymerase sigma factor [Terriglobia bacterium]|jgi:RNA polymerase sigma-70 factor (ECF subfamily)
MELRASPLWMTGIGSEGDSGIEFARVLERAVSGDVSAFEQIVIRYERRVLTLAWRLLGRGEDAEDASQEVFLRAFRFLHRFDSRRPFEPWLVKLTVNVCRDIGRKRPVVTDLDTESLRARGDPHQEWSAEEQKQILHAALQDLPGKERAAVVLRDIEGFSTAEVAEILGSSETTVRSQISTARLKIRKALKRRRI